MPKTLKVIRKICRCLMLLTLYSSLLLASACQRYVAKLWEPPHYEEIFQYFIASNNLITFLGDEFHYVFRDNYGVLFRLLSFENRDELVINTEETKIAVDRNNNFEGRLVIETLSIDLPDNQIKFLIGLGFRKKSNVFRFEADVRGTRYINNVQFRGNFLKLSIPYRIEITQAAGYNPAKIVAKSAVTPLAFVADVFVSIGAILLMPFYD